MRPDNRNVLVCLCADCFFASLISSHFSFLSCFSPILVSYSCCHYVVLHSCFLLTKDPYISFPVFSSFSQIPCKCHILLLIILMLNLKFSAYSQRFSCSFVRFYFQILFWCVILFMLNLTSYLTVTYLFFMFVHFCFSQSYYFCLFLVSHSVLGGILFYFSLRYVPLLTLILSLALLTRWILL